MANRLDMFWISHTFLQLSQSSCINKGYKSDHAIIEMKWVDGSFDKCYFYYKISFEVSKSKHYIQDEKNMLLEVQMDCENKSKKFQWEYIKM